MAPMAARADYSICTKAVRSQVYFITDVDTDWGGVPTTVLRLSTMVENMIYMSSKILAKLSKR